MAFFNSAVTVLQTLVIALGAGLGIWGAINLLEGYGNDNPGAKSQGMKHSWLAAVLPSSAPPLYLCSRTVRLITKQGGNRLWTAYSNRSQTG